MTNDLEYERKQTSSKHLRLQFTGLFFFSYFGLGALLPLLSIYLESIGFNGIQIGSIYSIRSILAILAPPIWGLFSDKYRNHKILLMITFIMSFIIGIFMPFIRSFLLFSLIFAAFNIFMTASTPLSDSIALHSPITFGSIRKWGAYGFAFAALISGYLAKVIDVTFIFVVLSASLIAALLSCRKLTINIQTEEVHHLSKELPILFKNKKFLLFLLFTFLTGNTLIAHNTFFGLLYKELGGNIAWTGLAFFLFAVSEAPFMEITNKLITKFGIYNVLIISNIIGILRWFFYYRVKNIFLILLLFPLQGMFFGTFLASSATFIKDLVHPSVRSTAVSLHAAVFIGLGGAVSNIVGGYIYDYINIESVYGYFAFTCTLGLFIIIFMKYLDSLQTKKAL